MWKASWWEDRNAKTLCYGKYLKFTKKIFLFLYALPLTISFLFQYYEMSYGLNVEMHKQVSVWYLCN